MPSPGPISWASCRMLAISRVGVARGALQEVGRHPASADVDQRDHLELTLDHVAQAQAVRPRDLQVAEHVVDDRGVADHQQHRTRRRDLAPSISYLSPKRSLKAENWARSQRGPQPVDPAAAAHRAPPEGASGEEPDAEQGEQRPDLVEQKPPEEERQADAGHRLARAQLQVDVDDQRAEQQQRQQRGDDHEAEQLGGDAPTRRTIRFPRGPGASNRGPAPISPSFIEPA